MQFSAEEIWRTNTIDLINLLNTNVLVPKSRIVHFYAPSFMYYKTRNYKSSQFHFPTLSVTGTSCTLDCKHCEGKVLKTMQPVKTPEKLIELASKLKQHGALGCLISGGCRQDGSVPLKQFLPAIKKIKHELDLTVFVHTGIINLDSAIALKNAGVDVALIDIIGSEATIRKIGNTNVTVKDYIASLKALENAKLKYVPHVIVGLYYGKLKDELESLTIISSTKPTALVIIAFMPIQGTAMAEVKPPQPIEIAKVIATARLMFPKTPLALGCVRPKGKHRAETDVLALKSGVDAIAFPSEKAVEYAKTHGYTFSFSSYCCAQIYEDAALRSSSK